MADGVTINEGTSTIIATDDVSGTQYQVIKLDMGGNGAASPFTGTITEVANLAKGTVTRLEGGTIGVVSSITNLAAGTVQINPKPSKAVITYGTTVGGTAATGVTLISAPGVGTSIYLNEISVINRGTAALQAYVGFGTAATAGTSQVVAGNMAANGGIQKSYPTAIGGHITNLALLGSIAAVGTVDVNLSYWVE